MQLPCRLTAGRPPDVYYRQVGDASRILNHFRLTDNWLTVGSGSWWLTVGVSSRKPQTIAWSGSRRSWLAQFNWAHNPTIPACVVESRPVASQS